MDTRRLCSRTVSICSILLIAGYVLIFLSACGNSTSPTPSLIPVLPSTIVPVQQTITPVATQPIRPTQTPTCVDNLTFVDDATIPDGTIVAPGSSLDKQWLVQNSGSCNWDSRYRLRFISGDKLGASIEQALYPARAGSQANLRILFVAPQSDGEYLSEWQAFDSNGIPFGDSFFIKVVVQQ
jgi:hypothetical protein